MRMAKPLIALTLSVSVLSGCGLAAQVTDTQTMKPAGNGVHLTSGDIQFSSLVVVALGDTAALSGTLVNNGAADDQVVGIAIDKQIAYLNPADAVVKAGSVLRFGFANEANADAELSLEPGTAVMVEFLMASGASAKGEVMVVAPEGAWADVTAAPAPAPSVTPSESGSPNA